MKRLITILIIIFAFMVFCVVYHNVKGVSHPNWAKEIGAGVELTIKFIIKFFKQAF